MNEIWWLLYYSCPLIDYFSDSYLELHFFHWHILILSVTLQWMILKAASWAKNTEKTIILWHTPTVFSSIALIGSHSREGRILYTLLKCQALTIALGMCRHPCRLECTWYYWTAWWDDEIKPTAISRLIQTYRDL